MIDNDDTIQQEQPPPPSPNQAAQNADVTGALQQTSTHQPPQPDPAQFTVSNLQSLKPTPMIKILIQGSDGTVFNPFETAKTQKIVPSSLPSHVWGRSPDASQTAGPTCDTRDGISIVNTSPGPQGEALGAQPDGC